MRHTQKRRASRDAPKTPLRQAPNRETAFWHPSGPTSLPWGLSIDPAHRPPGYEAYAAFHPTFLYELLFNLALAAGLVALGRTHRIRPPGLFALYVSGYSAFRIFEELLRVDPAHHLFGLRLNFYVAVALTVAGLAWLVCIQRGGVERVSARRGGALLAAAFAVCAVAGCGHGALAAHP